MASHLEITQVRSTIGATDGQRGTLRALGLRRIRHSVVHPDRDSLRGMLAKVAHLVDVRYVDEDEVIDLEPGQEPKGPGVAPAGPSVVDTEAEELAEATEEALSEPGEVDQLGDLVKNPPTLRTTDTVGKPKQRQAAADEDELTAPAGSDEAQQETDDTSGTAAEEPA